MIKFLGGRTDRELALDHRDEVRVGAQPLQHLRRKSKASGRLGRHRLEHVQAWASLSSRVYVGQVIAREFGRAAKRSVWPGEPGLALYSHGDR